MKTTNKSIIANVFGFIKKREEFNSDIEFLSYLYSEYLEVSENEINELKNLAKDLAKSSTFSREARTII